jgi:hypothetical protein
LFLYRPNHLFHVHVHFCSVRFDVSSWITDHASSCLLLQPVLPEKGQIGQGRRFGLDFQRVPIARYSVDRAPRTIDHSVG